MKFASLNDLYLQQLKDLHSAESQLIKALPKMAEAARNPALRNAFIEHLEQTKGHLDRLKQVEHLSLESVDKAYQDAVQSVGI